MRSPWRIFIASSGKGLRYAKAIKTVIDQQFGATVCFLWDQGAFEEGRSFLDSLERLTEKYNCGLAVFTADDRVGDLMAPRDNVVLEFGLFLGTFRRDRTFLLVESRKNLKLPTDYEGITQNRFFPAKKHASTEDLRNTVLAACTTVVERLNAVGLPDRADPLRRIEANWLKNHAGQEFKLYSFCGLNDSKEGATPDSNEEDVYHLWADAGAGSWIRAQVLDEKSRRPRARREHLLQVDFENRSASFPGNVSVRLRKRSVVLAPPGGFRHLLFSARIPPRAPTATPGPGIAMGVRVVDALTTHWEYSRAAHEYRMFTVKPGDGWTTFDVVLTDKNSWSVFGSDGNYLYHDVEPDFSQILAVVLELGAVGKGRPGAGGGVVQLKDFHLK